MSRSELSTQAAAELAALDAILDGEAVGEEHLELAALVDSVRRLCPTLDDDGRARLDARLRPASAAGRRRALARGRRPGPIRAGRLALAGGPIVAVVVAVAVVAGSGVLNGTGPARSSNTLGHGAPLTRHIPATSPPSAAAVAPSGATSTTSALGTAVAPAAGAGASAPASPTNFTARNVNPRGRLVARGASLTLASTPDQMQNVADEVVSSTERLGGIVESSNVSVHGPSSYASFSLSVPSARLGQLLASLSSLSSVRSLDQSTNDITNSYDRAAAELSDEKAQRAGLIKALAAAYTLSAEQTIQAKIAHLDREIAAASQTVGGLLTRGHNANVSVQVVAAAAAAGGGGPVDPARSMTRRRCSTSRSRSRSALAITLPVCLVGGPALPGASSTLRCRSREQASASSRLRPAATSPATGLAAAVRPSRSCRPRTGAQAVIGTCPGCAATRPSDARIAGYGSRSKPPRPRLRVGVEGDVGDRVAVSDEELLADSARAPSRRARGIRRRGAPRDLSDGRWALWVRDPEARPSRCSARGCTARRTATAGPGALEETPEVGFWSRKK